MAHFKRGRATTRKEGKRLRTKQHRAAEGQILNGGHTPNLHWDYPRPADLPLSDAVPALRRRARSSAPRRSAVLSTVNTSALPKSVRSYTGITESRLSCTSCAFTAARSG